MFPLNMNTQKKYPFSEKPAINNFYSNVAQRIKLQVKHQKPVPATSTISEERSCAQADMQSTF